MRARLAGLLIAASSIAGGGIACGGDAAAPTITAFTASASAVGLGDRVELTWAVEGANRIDIVAAPGGALVQASATLAGSVPSGALTATTRFTLTAQSAEGATATASVEVTVDGSLLRVTRFIALPEAIEPGEDATLSWTVSGSPIGQVRVLGVAGAVLTTGVEASGSLVVSPTDTTVYTLEVSNPGATVTATAAVTVRATAPTITRFSATPNPAVTGTRGTVSWETAGATEVQIERDGAVVRPWNAAGAAMGFTAFTFEAQSSVFTLRARNAFGEVSQDLTISTLPRPTAVLTVTPATFTTLTATVTVAWVATDADSVTLTVGGVAPAGFSGQLSGSVTVTVDRTVEVVLTAQNAVEMAMDSERIRRVAIFTQDVVTGPALAPLVGAAVRVEDASGTRFAEGVTDAAGRATLEIESEMFPVSVSVARADHFAAAVVGLEAPLGTALRIDPLPTAGPEVAVGEVAGTFFNKGSINDTVVITGVDVEGSEGAGVSYSMGYLVNAEPLTLVALDFDVNDQLHNAVVTSTVRTPGPLSVPITFPRPALVPQSTVVSIAIPATGVFAGEPFALGGQSVVKQRAGKNDVVVGASTLGPAAAGVFPWTISSFAEPGLEVDLAGLAIVGNTVRITVLQRGLAAAGRIDVAPLDTFTLSATDGALGDLRIDFAGSAYDAAIIQLGSDDVPTAYRVILPAARAHAAVRIPRLPSTVGFRGLGVGIMANVNLFPAAYALGGASAALLSFDDPSFGFPAEARYVVERQGGSFAIQGF